MPRLAPHLALLVALGLGLAPRLSAQDPVDIAGMERTFGEVAKVAIPRTVLVKAHAAGGQMGSGSGAIISQDGLILTCSHVIEIGESLEVVLASGKSYQARVLGKNTRQDYALIKVEAQGLDFFARGDSDQVKAGDWVVALGHPGGPYPDLQPAFAAGKVRALHAKLPVGMMQKYYNDAIMTDCPIYAGDSGGPLVNLKGELVGINGAIVMINEFAFAVPMNQIQAELPKLEQGQTIEGLAAGPEAFQEMSKLISPEDYQKMMSKMMKNLPDLLGGEDSPLAKLFGEDGPLKNLFGGQGPGGEGMDLQKMMEQMFGGQGGPGGEGMDLQKMMEQMFGGQGGPGGNEQLQKMMEQMFGGQGGEAPDLQKMMEQLFGGGQGGEAPDLQKMLEDLMGGRRDGPGRNRDEGDQRPAPAPRGASSGFLGIRAAQDQGAAPGVLVDMVVDLGPAAAGGIIKGDCIVSVDGKPTKNLEGLRQALVGKGPGAKITVELQRTTFVDSVPVPQRHTVEVTLGERTQ